MRHFLTLIILLSLSTISHADPMNLIQLQRSSYGGIDADEDNIPYNVDDYKFEKYDMSFQRSYSMRAIYSIMYISAQRSITNLHADIPDTTVETAAIGFALAGNAEENRYINTYCIGAIGLGAGRFIFKDPTLNDWEGMIEVSLEGGFEFSKHLLLGAGFTYQEFGEIGETKAHMGLFYISTGISF